MGSNIRHMILVVMFSVLTPLPVSGGGDMDMATEGTQTANGVILGLIQWADNYIKKASEAIQKYEEVSQLRFKDLPFVREILPVIENSKDLVKQGNALAYGAADLERTMKDKYKNYKDYLAGFAGNPTRTDYETAYRDWSKTHTSNVRQILLAQGLHGEEFSDDEAMLKTLKDKSRTAEGRMQVLQTGQQIATENVNQLQKLKLLMIEQTNLHAGYFADKQAQKSYKEAAKSKFYENKNDTIIDDGKGYR